MKKVLSYNNVLVGEVKTSNNFSFNKVHIKFEGEKPTASIICDALCKAMINCYGDYIGRKVYSASTKFYILTLLEDENLNTLVIKVSETFVITLTKLESGMIKFICTQKDIYPNFFKYTIKGKAEYEEKKEVLESLSKEELISLLMVSETDKYAYAKVKDDYESSLYVNTEAINDR